MDGFLGKRVSKHRMARLSWVLLFLILALTGNTSADFIERPGSDNQTVSDDKDVRPGLIGSSPEALRAWQKLRAGTNYRIARPGDFSLSTDRYRAYGDGDFNRDGIYGDFAIIVIDDTVPGASRFGLVIFNARSDSRGYRGPFWLYRGVDLSATSLNLISHGPLIVAKTPDKFEAEVCMVKWNRAKGSYWCEDSK